MIGHAYAVRQVADAQARALNAECDAAEATDRELAQEFVIRELREQNDRLRAALRQNGAAA